MLGLERDLIVPQRYGPEAYKNLDIPPVLVTRLTHSLLGFFQNGQVRDRQAARRFFLTETVPYLKAAEAGARVIFRAGRTCFERGELEISEAADHARVVFSALPDCLDSDFLPNGFSKKGTLRPPETRGEYVLRVRELREGIRRVGEGEVGSGVNLDGNATLIRTFGFFKVASELPFKSRVDESSVDPLSEDRLNALWNSPRF